MEIFGEGSEKKVSDAEYVVDFTGTFLGAAGGIFKIGKCFPIIGGICDVMVDVIKDTQELHRKVKDVVEIARRVVDVAKYLEGLNTVLKHISSEQVQYLETEIIKIHDLLIELQNCTTELKDAGFIKMMMVGTSTLLIMSKIDAEISTRLSSIKDIYSLARDDTFAKQLNNLTDLLSRNPQYLLEKQVNELIVNIGQKCINNESMTEQEARQQVLNDIETLNDLEKKGGISNEIVQAETSNLMDVDKKLDSVISLVYAVVAEKSYVRSPMEKFDVEFSKFLFKQGLSQYGEALYVNGVTNMKEFTLLSHDNLVESIGIPSIRAARLIDLFGGSKIEIKEPESIELNENETVQKLIHTPSYSLTAQESIETVLAITKAGSIEARKARGYKITAFLGTTGVGKSTLINALEGCAMKRLEIFGKKVVEVSPNSQVEPIVASGHGSISHTLLPNIVFGKLGVCMDAPGFFDNRAPAVNIANAVNVAAAVGEAACVRIVLLAEYSAMKADRSSGVIALLRNLIDFFGSVRRLMFYSSSIVLIITQAPTEKDNRTGNALTLKNVKDMLTEASRSFCEEDTLKIMTDLIHRCLLFDYFDTPPTWNSIKQLHAVISKLPPVYDPSNIFRPILGYNDEVELRRIVEDQVNQASRLLNVDKDYAAVVEILKNINSIERIGHPIVTRLVSYAKSNFMELISSLERKLNYAALTEKFVEADKYLSDLNSIISHLKLINTEESFFDLNSLEDRVDQSTSSLRLRKEEVSLFKQLMRNAKDSDEQCQALKYEVKKLRHSQNKSTAELKLLHAALQETREKSISDIEYLDATYNEQINGLRLRMAQLKITGEEKKKIEQQCSNLRIELSLKKETVNDENNTKEKKLTQQILEQEYYHRSTLNREKEAQDEILTIEKARLKAEEKSRSEMMMQRQAREQAEASALKLAKQVVEAEVSAKKMERERVLLSEEFESKSLNELTAEDVRKEGKKCIESIKSTLEFDLNLLDRAHLSRKATISNDDNEGLRQLNAELITAKSELNVDLCKQLKAKISRGEQIQADKFKSILDSNERQKQMITTLHQFKIDHTEYVNELWANVLDRLENARVMHQKAISDFGALVVAANTRHSEFNYQKVSILNQQILSLKEEVQVALSNDNFSLAEQKMKSVSQLEKNIQQINEDETHFDPTASLNDNIASLKLLENDLLEIWKATPKSIKSLVYEYKLVLDTQSALSSSNYEDNFMRKALLEAIKEREEIENSIVRKWFLSPQTEEAQEAVNLVNEKLSALPQHIDSVVPHFQYHTMLSQLTTSRKHLVDVVKPLKKQCEFYKSGCFDVIPQEEWENDRENCSLCSTTFSVFFWRHHCRCCGIVVCKNCSQKKLVGDHISGISTRELVCYRCVEKHSQVLAECSKKISEHQKCFQAKEMEVEMAREKLKNLKQVDQNIWTLEAGAVRFLRGRLYSLIKLRQGSTNEVSSVNDDDAMLYDLILSKYIELSKQEMSEFNSHQNKRPKFIQLNNAIHKDRIENRFTLELSGFSVEYIGAAFNGKAWGQGGFKSAEGRGEYYGDFEDNKRHGRGVFIWQDGRRYEGEFQNDKREGRGIFTDPKGDKFEGMFRDNDMHKGVLTWPTGQIYDGEFKNNKRDGKGLLVTASGEEYDGEWKDDKRHGQGVCILNNGEKYVGEWKDNQRHGRGVETVGPIGPDRNYKGYEMYTGSWVKNMKEDYAAVISIITPPSQPGNGYAYQTTEWKNDKLVKRLGSWRSYM